MSDELKPCPNLDCRSYRTTHVRNAIGVFSVSCGCGVAGPYAGNAKAAIAAWNALPRTVQAAPSDRERALELACKEVLATPSFGALRSADAVDTIRIVRAALAAAPDHIGGVTEMVEPDHISQQGKKVKYAALAPEPWGGTDVVGDA